MTEIPTNQNSGEYKNEPNEVEMRKRNISDNLQRMAENYQNPIEQNVDGVRSLSMPVTCTDSHLLANGYETFNVLHTPPTVDFPTDMYAVDGTRTDGAVFSFVYSSTPDGMEKWQMDHPEAEQDRYSAKEMGTLLFQAGDEDFFRFEGEMETPDMQEIGLAEAREVDHALSLALREIGVEPKVIGDNS